MTRMENFSDYSIFNVKEGIRPFQLFRLDMKALYTRNYPEDVLSQKNFTDLAASIWHTFPQLQDFYHIGTLQLAAKVAAQRNLRANDGPSVLQRYSPGRVLTGIQHDVSTPTEKLGYNLLQSINLWRATLCLRRQDPLTDELHTLFPVFLFCSSDKSKHIPLKERRACRVLNDLETLFTKRPGVNFFGMENWDTVARPARKRVFPLVVSECNYTDKITLLILKDLHAGRMTSRKVFARDNCI